jgi:putative DNA primase/helicase
LTETKKTISIPGKKQTMPPEQAPHHRPQEQRDYARIAQDLRERLQSGLLSELTAFPQFVVWKYTVEQGKLKKRPFNPRTTMPARTNDSRTWTDVTGALKALATGRYNGIGFVFADSDPFTGTDLDACVGKERTIAPWAQEIITSLASYTEYSPSKLGVHILTQATLPGAGRKAGEIELYSHDRFFTITTDHLHGTPTAIAQRQQEVDALYHQVAPRGAERDAQNTVGGRGSGGALTGLPPEAANDPLLQKLLAGDSAGYPSPSSADFVLVLKLLHWTGDNLALTRELFLQSGLYREEKTERKTGTTTYLDMTIQNALKKRRNPPQRR